MIALSWAAIIIGLVCARQAARTGSWHWAIGGIACAVIVLDIMRVTSAPGG